MGTGIISLLLLSLPFPPYPPDWAYYLALSLFVLNTISFTLFLLFTILRYILYPDSLALMLRTPSQSLFLGTLPMALCTLLNTFTLTCVPLWGSPALNAAFTLWILSSVLAVAACASMPFVLMHARPRLLSLSAMTPTWLLPVVSPIVAAASGGVVAQALAASGRVEETLGTVVASYCLWAMGIGLAMSVLVIYVQRLALHRLPEREVIVSAFLPMGPLGQGSYGVILLGKVGRDLLPATKTLAMRNGSETSEQVVGEVLYALSWWIGLGLWGYGLVWLVFAVVSLGARAWRWRAPFNMMWWGFTFPLGVYAMATLELGRELGSETVDVIGTVSHICEVLGSLSLS